MAAATARAWLASALLVCSLASAGARTQRDIAKKTAQMTEEDWRRVEEEWETPEESASDGPAARFEYSRSPFAARAAGEGGVRVQAAKGARSGRGEAAAREGPEEAAANGRGLAKDDRADDDLCDGRLPRLLRG